MTAVKIFVNKIYMSYLSKKSYTYIINLILGITKIIVGMFACFYSMCISALYNIAVGFSKRAIHKSSNVIVGLMIIVSSILYIGYSLYTIKFHSNTQYHMYIGMLIATVTFTQIAISIIGIVKAKRKANRTAEIEKYSNLSNAIISLALTQRALLSFTKPNEDMSLYNGIGGIIFSVVSLLVGIAVLTRIQKNY